MPRALLAREDVGIEDHARPDRRIRRAGPVGLRASAPCCTLLCDVSKSTTTLNDKSGTDPCRTRVPRFAPSPGGMLGNEKWEIVFGSPGARLARGGDERAEGGVTAAGIIEARAGIVSVSSSVPAGAAARG